MTLDNSNTFIRQLDLMRDNVGSFDEYPFCIPAVKYLETLSFHPKVTYLIGENGTGKSTLLEAIAVKSGFNAEGGTRNFNFSTRESHSELNEYIQIKRGFLTMKEGFFLRAESFFNVATQVEDLGLFDGDRSLHEQSHGESFISLLTTKFKPYGLYVLDEPEAALSPARQLSVLTIMHKLIKQNCQFVIATHSPILMAYPDSKIYLLSDTGIENINYYDTEHYKITHDFFEHKDAMLKILLNDD